MTWADVWGWDGWDAIGGVIAGIWDDVDDEPAFWDAIAKYIEGRPELDYDKIMEMAVTQANLNRPDVETPFGRVTTDRDPKTGESVTRQEYTKDVQGLAEMLTRNAGADINPYAAPDSMRGQMLGGLMNDRETHMGLPLSEWTAPDFSREGARDPVGNYWDREDDDEESDPAGKPFNRVGEGPSWEDYYGDRNWEARDLEQINQMADFFDWSQRQGHDWSSSDWNINDALNEYSPDDSQLEGSDPPAWKQWIIENAPGLGAFIGRVGGAIAGVPGGATVGRWIASYFVDNYWEKNQWQNPADPATLPQSADDFVSNWMDYGYTPEQNPTNPDAKFYDSEGRLVDGHGTVYVDEYGNISNTDWSWGNWYDDPSGDSPGLNTRFTRSGQYGSARDSGPGGVREPAGYALPSGGICNKDANGNWVCTKPK
jgi:hypothetical protein